MGLKPFKYPSLGVFSGEVNVLSLRSLVLFGNIDGIENAGGLFLGSIGTAIGWVGSEGCCTGVGGIGEKLPPWPNAEGFWALVSDHDGLDDCEAIGPKADWD